MVTIDPRDFLTRVYHAGVAAADPRRATRQAVDHLTDITPTVWLLAAGKGGHAMASGAVESLRTRGVRIAGGLVVAHEPDAHATHGLNAMEGDHPTPADGSFAAADRLTAVAAHAPADADAIVLISGGATSLIAAPVVGLSTNELQAAFSALLASGADIGLTNAIRKRLLRFGAGRLALELRARRIHCLLASDVIGNDPASIASGPCVPDSGSARAVRDRARDAGVWDALPGEARRLFDAIIEGRLPDSPPPDHPRFASTSARVILDRTDAERGAAAAAAELGAVVEVREVALTGDAATAGTEFARHVVSRAHHGRRECIIWSGETTVTLGETRGRGGRCQEFALACAAALDAAGSNASGIAVLAAGTDGRDGPTGAAGAIVDATTWSEIKRRGIDPAASLGNHASYDALQSVDALLKTGPTGTNVNDLVIALVSP